MSDHDDGTDAWPGLAWMGLVVGTLAGSIMTLVVLSALARGQTNLSFGVVGVLCMQQSRQRSSRRPACASSWSARLCRRGSRS